MTTKEQVLELVGKLADNATMAEILYELEVLRKINIGLEQIERGEVFDHDEVFEELLRDNEENQDHLVRAGKGRSRSNKEIYQSRRPQKSQGIHKAHERTRKGT
jgi:ABC-type methionine transport system ATPase subunit